MEEADAKLADGALSATDDSPAVSEPNVDNKKRTRWRRRMTAAALVAVVLAAALVLPGMVNLGHYKRQIAALMSRSMGRPVRMSGVELRLLPTPGFVLHDLAVSEDPEFGAEPILSARTVVASIRVLSLLKGRIEISRVSVDEASLNLVRSAEGRWNLEALMMGAQPGLSGNTGATRHIPGTSAHFPYLEATESRVHLKNGVVKSPYSIEDTNLSLWQDAPGAVAGAIAWTANAHGHSHEPGGYRRAAPGGESAKCGAAAGYAAEAEYGVAKRAAGSAFAAVHGF